jgi:hypothetical protein
LDARRGDTIVARSYSSLKCVALRCVARERERERV